MLAAMIPVIRSRRTFVADLVGVSTPSSLSQVGGDLSRIESGPCKVTYRSVACGHTMGGVSMSIKPQLRDRKVDEYGEHGVDLIYVGDMAEVKCRFAEKTMAVVQAVYQFGNRVTETLHVGYGPGAKGGTVGGELVLHPLDGDGTRDDVTFFKATVSDIGEVQFGSVTADRVFDCTFKCVTDATKADGQLLGKVGV